MVVYDIQKDARMGVTVRPVRIVSVDIRHGTVRASWNSNPARTFYGNQVKRWRPQRPATTVLPNGFVSLVRLMR